MALNVVAFTECVTHVLAPTAGERGQLFVLNIIFNMQIESGPVYASNSHVCTSLGKFHTGKTKVLCCIAIDKSGVTVPAYQL